MIKKILSLVALLIAFHLSAQSQPDKTDIEFIVSGYDTTLLDPTNGVEEYMVTEQVSGIKSYKQEPVYKEFEVSGLEHYYGCTAHMAVVISQTLRKHKKIVPAGKYTFGLGWALVSKKGELVYYYLSMPNKFPFENYDDNENALAIKDMNELLKKELHDAIEKNKKWSPGIKNGLPVHAYFDEPIEFSIEIK